jgi:hypothetical protein
MKSVYLICLLATTVVPMAAHAGEGKPVAAAPACPVLRVAPARVTDQMVTAVAASLNKAFDAALGLDAHRVHEPKVVARLAARTVDRERMADLANAAGCAALLDERSSCSQYFDTELGDPLSVFMRMKKTAPLRRQFEQAVAQVPVPELKRAGQACIKLIGTP